MTEETLAPGELVRDEALAWFARMRGPDAGALEAEFSAWLDHDLDRRIAYAEVERTFDRAAILKQSLRYGTNLPTSAVAPPQLRPALAFASVALLAAGLTWYYHARPAGRVDAWTNPARLATQKGEIRTFRLIDGSSLTLDTHSNVQVEQAQGERHLRLLTGRARITVKPGGKPFLVDAGAGRLSAHGGTFDVAVGSGEITISPLKGQGRVGPAYQPLTAALWNPGRLVGPGTTLRYGPRSFADAAFQQGPARGRDRAWPTGWATYRSVPLNTLVAEVNRYAGSPVVLDGPTLGHKQVSGRFHLTDAPGFSQAVAELFDLEIRHVGSEIHLRQR